MNKLLKHTRFFPFLLVILSLLFVALPIGIAYAAQLFEHYNPDPHRTTGITIYKNYWSAQTFTAESAHSVTSIRLYFERTGDPGNVTVSIQGTDGGGQPDGTELASETIEGITLPDLRDPIGWTEILFTTPCNLTKDKKYAIVVRAPSADVNQGFNLTWRGYHDGDGAYSGGNYEKSNDSGLNWVSDINDDLEFEVYGEETPPPAPAGVGGEVYPVNRITLVAPWITLAAAIIAGGVFLISRKAYR